MTNNDKKLMIELMKGLANGSIDLDKAPILKKMIQDYLHNFDYQIEDSVSDLKNKADNYNQGLINTANGKYHNIIKTGKTYQKALKNAIDKRYSKKKVDQLVNTDIHSSVLKAIGVSGPVIDHYLASVSDNTRRMDTLSKKAKTLSREVNKAHQKISQTNSKFWYGIFGAFVLGAIFSFIAL